jgi:predicted nuclease with TOPRIM domain
METMETLENLNKAVSDINEMLKRLIFENNHLKDMVKTYELTIKELQTQIEELQPLPIENQKGFFNRFFY